MAIIQDQRHASRYSLPPHHIAHAFDHFVLPLSPTAVIAIAVERDLEYGTLIGLPTGALVAFGLFSLPMGWIAERVGRRGEFASPGLTARNGAAISSCFG